MATLAMEESVSEWRSAGLARDWQDAAWENGERVPGNDPALWRKDEFGAWIYRLDYGHRRSEFGWEIVEPLSSDRQVLRPMQWQNYIDQVAARTQSRVSAMGLRNGRQLL